MNPLLREAGPFNASCGLYWYAADYHDGQDSELYRLLSTSLYKPGALEKGPEPESASKMIYDSLVAGILSSIEVADYVAEEKDDETVC